MVASPLFYAAQANVTGSKWDEGEMKPFTLGFLCFLFLTFSPLQWLWRRDVDAELSGAEDLRYQEAYDESDGLMAQFRPRSAEAEAAAAQAQAEAQAAEAEAEAEAEVEAEAEEPTEEP